MSFDTLLAYSWPGKFTAFIKFRLAKSNCYLKSLLDVTFNFDNFITIWETSNCDWLELRQHKIPQFIISTSDDRFDSSNVDFEDFHKAHSAHPTPTLL